MGVLSAGIRSLLRKTEGADLSRPAEAPDPGARSSRNGGRHHLGTVGEIIPESVGGIIPERRAASPGIGTPRQAPDGAPTTCSRSCGSRRSAGIQLQTSLL